jgi:DNA modification methylase
MVKKFGFNGLTPKEWAKEAKVIFELKHPPRNDKQKEHGATFPIQLPMKFIKTHCIPNGLVLDPFVGTGSTLEACKYRKRHGIGFELNEEYYSWSKQIINQETLIPLDLKVYNDDCRNMLKYIKPNTIDLTFTSPPYANLIHKSVKDRTDRGEKNIFGNMKKSTIKVYSDKNNDFGNLNVEQWEKDIEELMKKIYTVTKNKGYNIWVVMDFRNTKQQQYYIPLHEIVKDCGVRAGFYHVDYAIWDQTRNRKLSCGGYSGAFYFNQNITWIIVMRKYE